MRRSFLAGIVVIFLSLLFTAATVRAATDLELGLGLAPGWMQVVDVHLDLTALHHGHLGWYGKYASPADPLAVWHTFRQLANMQLEEGTRSSDSCLKLFQVERFYVVVRTMTVKLCAASRGTQVYLSQRIDLPLLTHRCPLRHCRLRWATNPLSLD